MYRYLFRKNPHILLYFILAPLRALSSVAVAGALSIAIDFATNGDLSDVWKYVVFFSVYILLDLFIDAADQAVRLKTAKNPIVALKSDVYHKLSRMCYVHFFQRNSADYLSNMTTDVETLRESYFYIILNMYANFLRCAVALGILVWLSPALGVFVLVTSLLQTLVPIMYSKKLERAGKEYSDAQEDQMKVLKENLSAFLTAKTFHMEDQIERNYVASLENAEERRRNTGCAGRSAGRVRENNIQMGICRHGTGSCCPVRHCRSLRCIHGYTAWQRDTGDCTGADEKGNAGTAGRWCSIPKGI